MTEPSALADEQTPDAPDLSTGNAEEEALGSPWEDLRAYVALPRLTGVALSHDGTSLVASVSGLNSEKNTYVTSLWRVDPSGQRPARRLTRGVEGEAVTAFLRDGSLLFSSKRTVPAEGDEPVKDSTKALWCLPGDGGEAYVLVRRDGGWEGVTTCKDADTAVFAVSAHPGTDGELADAEKREARTKAKVAAILHTGVPVRYWDHDLGAETTRLLAADITTGDGDASVSAEAFQALSGDVGAALAGPYSLSNDGAVLASGWNTALPKGVVRSDLAIWDVASGEKRLVSVEGHEFQFPLVSPDGSLVAAALSSDPTPQQTYSQWLVLVDRATGEVRDLTRDWDRWAEPVAWSPDAKTLYVVADEDGDAPVFAVDVARGAVRRLTAAGAFGSVQVAPDGTLYALRTSYTDPGSIVRIDPVTGTTTDLLSPVAYPELPGRLERVETTADDGVRVPGFLLLPTSASADQPAKLALWIHGGPVSSWNSWSWRWCPWLLVSRGYAVLLPDPALSTGYGRDYVQRGWGRWGGEPYTDLMALTDAVEQRPDIDHTNTCAMGGSFGGYMANWVAGHTDRFKAIVSHASLWNLDSFGGTTDAPWYWDQEMSPEMRAQFSPHLFAGDITTPMLVVHGDKDYRVPIGEGLSLWWALVRNFDGAPEDLPHRFLYFPDENHWVLTPNHARVWYDTVLAFLDEHVDQAPARRPDFL